jgi:two-component sensor histidine kinase
MFRQNRPVIHFRGENSEESSQRPRKTASSVLAALVIGCATFLLGATVATTTYYFAPGSLTASFADDIVIAVGAGLMVLFYERRRNRYLIERLRIIAEMNHHVRNALQVVSYSADQQQDEEVRTMLRQSSERIEWALREILQGRKSA